MTPLAEQNIKQYQRATISLLRPKLRPEALLFNRELSLRKTPTLRFAYDESVERGVRMTKLIEDVTAELPEDEPDPEAD